MIAASICRPILPVDDWMTSYHRDLPVVDPNIAFTIPVE